ncbi:MAG: creatininase family protein [Alsobacter sp.]
MRLLASVTPVRALIVLAALAAGSLLVVSRPRTAPLTDTLEIKDMTWVQVRSAIDAGFDSIILPSGGIEQNGEHMVLAKHDYIVAAAAREIAAGAGRTLIAPVLSFVPEGQFDPPDGNMAYPGTLGLRDSTFEAVLEDVLRSLKRTGFRSIFLIADHGQSIAPQQRVADRLSQAWKADGTKVVSLDRYYADDDQRRFLLTRGETDQSIGSHAGIQDTSELLFVHPEGVSTALISRLPRREPSGGSGDPTRATAGLGKDLLAIKVRAALAQIRETRDSQ